jgi:hypothetical protein
MQADGGFGSRQYCVGCFASSVEFGPQQLADINTTRPAFKILWESVGGRKFDLLNFDNTVFTSDKKYVLKPASSWMTDVKQDSAGVPMK